MYYLFYNIYGDADELLLSKPSDVVAIPFGWDEESEKIRNEKLAELEILLPSLPALCYWQQTYTMRMVHTPTGEVQENDFGNCWDVVEIEKLPKPWGWEEIMLQTTKKNNGIVVEIDDFGNQTVTYL